MSFGKLPVGEKLKHISKPRSTEMGNFIVPCPLKLIRGMFLTVFYLEEALLQDEWWNFEQQK